VVDKLEARVESKDLKELLLVHRTPHWTHSRCVRCDQTELVALALHRTLCPSALDASDAGIHVTPYLGFLRATLSERIGRWGAFDAGFGRICALGELFGLPSDTCYL